MVQNEDNINENDSLGRRNDDNEDYNDKKMTHKYCIYHDIPQERSGNE